MLVLVTGGTGFVGSHVSRQLLGAGHAVRLLVRDRQKAQAYYQRLGEGMPLAEAVVDAGAVRFRPMLLTALAVVVGAGDVPAGGRCSGASTAAQSTGT